MEIRKAPEYRKEESYRKQKELLILKRDRLERLIDLLDDVLKGERSMSLEEFDKREIEEAHAKYVQEAKQRWGDTEAYAQSEKKTKQYTDKDRQRVNRRSDEIMQMFAERVGENPASAQVQGLVRQWQEFITEAYYDCSEEILAGLGEMYLADERFIKNIDQFGEGTAELMSRAIAIYCDE